MKKPTTRSPNKLAIDKTPLRPLSAEELPDATGGRHGVEYAKRHPTRVEY